MLFEDIIEYFQSFQGESPYVGEPTIFIRFRLCNLMNICPFCDTLEKMKSNVHITLPMKSVVQHIEQTGVSCLTFTGGEPLLPKYRQQIKQFIDNYYLKSFIQKTCKILIETNGQPLKSNIDDLLSVKHYITLIWSPKFLTEGDLDLNKEIFDILKAHNFNFYVKPVAYKEIHDQLEDFLTYISDYNHRIYLMPKGVTTNQLLNNSKDAVDLALKFNTRISPRMHLSYNLP